MKKINKIFLSLALILILSIPLLAGCTNTTAYAKYVNYEIKQETDGYYAIFQYEVKNENKALWGPGIDEYKFFFDNKEMQISYGNVVKNIYYDKDCNISVGVNIGQEDFLIEPHTTQTFYLKVFISENYFEFHQIQIVREGYGTIQTIKVK